MRGIRSLGVLSLAAASLVAGMAAGMGQAAPPQLPARLIGVLDRIEAAHTAGDIEAVWRVLAPAIGGLKEDVAARFEQALADRNLPPSKELLVQARMKLLIEGRAGALPAPAVQERLHVLAALRDRVQAFSKEWTTCPLLKGDLPVPTDIDGFDRRFDEIGTLQGSLQQAFRCASYAFDLATNLPGHSRRKLAEEERDLVNDCANNLITTLRTSEEDVTELTLETHLDRLRYGVQALQEQRLTKEKFVAATSTRRDIRVLRSALAKAALASKSAPATGDDADAEGPSSASNAASRFRREALSSPDLTDEVERLAHQAEELAGSLGNRSERFALGLEAWLRGRYGSGPDVWGLAKSEAAVADAELLRQVYMPSELPKSEGAAAIRGQSTSFPDRRHHYTWAWEDRRLITTSSKSGQIVVPLQIDYRPFVSPDVAARRHMKGPFQSFGTVAHMETTVTVPPQDPRLVYRIVGFVEYLDALALLDKFVEEAPPVELEAAQELVRSKTAFRIQTNLSQRVEGKSALSEQRVGLRDDFGRHGLEWIMALARVEVGAMLAGFTSHQNPFLCLAPTTFRQERVQTAPFGSAEFAEMLIDGLRTHYWSIVREDVIAKDYKSGVPENHLLTYGRRAGVAREFLRAVLHYTGSGTTGENLPAGQRKELETWDQTFVKVQRMMLYCLTFKVGREKKTRHDYAHIELRRWVRGGILHKELAGPSTRITSDRDQTPDAIRRILQGLDPTLIGCGCQ